MNNFFEYTENQYHTCRLKQMLQVFVGNRIAACMVGSVLSLAVGVAHASIVINLQESGGNVEATGSGSMDLTSFTTSSSPATNALNIVPSLGFVTVGTHLDTMYFYETLTGPTSFGTGALKAATSGTGDAFGIFGTSNGFYVPMGYTSLASLAGTATWVGDSFASLGLTPGSYIWTNAGETVTVNIGLASTPSHNTYWAIIPFLLVFIGCYGKCPNGRISRFIGIK